MKSSNFLLFLLFVGAKRRHHHENHRKRTNKGSYYKKVHLIFMIHSTDTFLYCTVRTISVVSAGSAAGRSVFLPRSNKKEEQSLYRFDNNIENNFSSS